MGARGRNMLLLGSTQFGGSALSSRCISLLAVKLGCHCQVDEPESHISGRQKKVPEQLIGKRIVRIAVHTSIQIINALWLSKSKTCQSSHAQCVWMRGF